MKAKSIIISMFVILALCMAAVSCNKDTPSTPVDPGNMDNPNNTEIPDSPTDCIDPEDAVTVNLRNDGGSVEILDWQIAINTANNFVSGSDYVTFVSVGEVSGLGCVTSIPQSGWSSQVAVIPGNGYVLKYEKHDGETGSYIEKYARIYVVRNLLNATNEGVLGAEIKYQENWYETPIVSTSILTDITPTSAMCGGNVTNDCGMSVTERGICWSTFQSPTINDNHAVSGTGIGNYTIQITDLTPGKKYYVRAYAKNDIGVSYGEQITFETSGEVPVVSTGVVTEITSTTAICGGNVTSDGGIVNTERGICWSTSEGPTINDNYAINGTGIGDYDVQMTNLMPNTLYYVRAYARNDIGISYGEQKAFRTISDNNDIDYSNIVLNELNGTDKFIEIYNKGDVDLSLEGMYIMKDDYVAGAIWTADATIVAPAHGYVLLYSEDVQIDMPDYPDKLIFHSGLSSKKTIRMTLFMPDGMVRDEFTRGITGEWGQTISNVSPQSYARIPNGGEWKLADPTPGGANPSFGEPIPQE